MRSGKSQKKLFKNGTVRNMNLFSIISNTDGKNAANLGVGMYTCNKVCVHTMLLVSRRQASSHVHL